MDCLVFYCLDVVVTDTLTWIFSSSLFLTFVLLSGASHSHVLEKLSITEKLQLDVCDPLWLESELLLLKIFLQIPETCFRSSA